MLRDASDLELIADLELVDRERVAQVRPSTLAAELDEVAQRAGVGLGEVALLGLGQVLLLDGAEGELDGVLAILVTRLDSGHRARAGLEDRDACVAFAGGQVHSGPIRTEVTGLVVRLPGGRVIRLGNPGVSPVRAVVEDERWMLHGRGFGWTIDVAGAAPRAASHVLPVPLPSQERNTAGALEHLAGALEVTVRRRGRVVWAGRSVLAGLEHGGLDRAQAELVRRGLDPVATHAALIEE